MLYLGKKVRIVFIIAASMFAMLKTNSVQAQTGTLDTLKVYAFVVDGDTIPGGRMLDVTMYTKMLPKWRQYWAEWTRLRNAVYVTYPYARAAGRIMNEVNARLANVTDKNARKAIIKSRE